MTPIPLNLNISKTVRNGWIATKLAHDGPHTVPYPGCAQGQGQRSRDTDTFVISRKRTSIVVKPGNCPWQLQLSSFFCISLLLSDCSCIALLCCECRLNANRRLIDHRYRCLCNGVQWYFGCRNNVFWVCRKWWITQAVTVNDGLISPRSFILLSVIMHGRLLRFCDYPALICCKWLYFCCQNNCCACLFICWIMESMVLLSLLFVFHNFVNVRRVWIVKENVSCVSYPTSLWCQSLLVCEKLTTVTD